MEWWNDSIVVAWGALTGGTLLGLLLSRLLASVRRRPDAPDAEEKIWTLKEACRLSRDAIVILDHERKILFANPAAERLTEIQVAQPLKELGDRLEFYHPDEKKWLGLEELFLRHRLRKGAESTRFNEMIMDQEKRTRVSVVIRTASLIQEGRSARGFDILTIHDISCEKKLFDLHHLNTVSGLPNQYKAYSEITAGTASGNARNRFAVMMVELDDASKLRSMLGYAEMETIITHIANVLRELTENPRVSVYHISYVTFMILLQQPGADDEIYALFDQFQMLMRENYRLELNKQKISFSAGVSVYPDQNSLYGLIDGAFAALAQAQENGNGHLIMADRQADRRIDHEILLNTEIEKGITKRDFKLYFQPIYDGAENRLAGAEVLLRWHHPEKGLIMPNVFIPIAEKSGLILNIGKYVIEESLKQLSRWNSFGFPPLQLSVNISLRELENQEFMNYLTRLLDKYDTGASRIKFEITEHATMINPTAARQKLDEVRELGIGISLDDFGTGYSSFSHLAEFPIETLKIDRSFVSDMTRDSSKQHIVSTMTKLGHSLGMNIVAEGVESKEEARMLASYGVDYLQGYYFSRPLPQLEFQYLLSHS